MKDLVFLMEPSKNEWQTQLKIGHLYLNRLTIDEDAAFEVLGIYDLVPSRYVTSDDMEDPFVTVANELKLKGNELQLLKLKILSLFWV